MNLLNFMFIQATQANNQLPELTGEEGETATELSLSFIELAVKGGWIMVPLFLLLTLAVYIHFGPKYLTD